jgi:hypothetical protein
VTADIKHQHPFAVLELGEREILLNAIAYRKAKFAIILNS